MDRLAIVHFHPLELYPPIQNVLNVLADKYSTHQVLVFTTANSVNLQPVYARSPSTTIFRLGKLGRSYSFAIRYVNYVYFNLGALLLLIRYRPDRVMYIETPSSFPVYFYKRFICRSARLYIHYHEYTSPEEYGRGNALFRFFHRLEKSMYAKAVWVSHTNNHRMDFFKRDISPILLEKGFILPNFPPKSWYHPTHQFSGKPVRIVYVGALSLTTMYTREFSDWVISQNGNVAWDIYSFNYSSEAKSYLINLNSSFITIKQGVNYDDLPDLLKGYDVGVILYNGHIPNYVFNAPNKLFEYLACGLAVWFPSVLISSRDYVTHNTYPEVMALDFTSLLTLKLDDLLNRQNRTLKIPSYFCEEALHELVANLTNYDS